MSAKTIRSLVQSWETVRFELLKSRISRPAPGRRGLAPRALRPPPAPGDGGQGASGSSPMST
ncbi:MAG: hypothetical protein M0C28_47525 [Candidatus Moduliflexus flocculans]|nr:hypothetical protein [Candidatus Moduliflexus flocculans]